MAQSAEAHIPIDIHYNKLLDWLINRRHCPQQWQGAALVVREKINVAIQDMPPVEEITQLLQGTYINYFHCLHIVELLKETEKGSKNIFGSYSSKRMKDWLEIVKLYEQNGTYLAEVAQLLMRNVNYEIPALKRQITKCKQMHTDCVRKEGEYAANAAELKQKYNTSCKQMGIEGRRVKSELLSLVQDLPSVYERLGQNAANLTPAANYYRKFVGFTLNNNDLEEECIPTLRYLMSKGNVTTYEWHTGKTPSRVEEPPRTFTCDEAEDSPADAGNQEIDWGDIGDGEIDFGISEDTDSAAIDWGDMGSGDAAEDAVCIEVVDDSTGNTTEEGVARGDEALTLLDNTEVRNVILNELLELEAFLTHRLQELNGPTDVLSSSQFESAPPELHVDTDVVQGMLVEVQSILQDINSPKMQELILIRSSPRYVERLTASLKKNIENAEKALSLSRLMVIRQQEAMDEQASVQPKLNLIREKTQQLKRQIEEEISKKYQNRKVNIMGEINTI